MSTGATRPLILLFAFAAVPATLAATALLPPVLDATGLLMVTALLLAALAGDGLFHRLSVALLTGAGAGCIAAFCQVQLGWSGSAPAPAGSAALVAAGTGCGMLANALALALGGTRGFGQGRRALHGSHARRTPMGGGTALARFVQARHPARLKAAYCRFHVAVCWSVALAWLALLGLVAWHAQHTIGQLGASTGLDLLPPPLARLLMACGALLLLAASAVMSWWVVASVAARVAVAAGALPPFGVGTYVRSGEFPSHWVAHEYTDRADDRPGWSDQA